MTRDEATTFAERWIRSWNERDLDAILAHYTDAVRFRSPRAAGLLGTPTIEGKEALASYWRAGLERITSLHFALDHVVWDGEGAELLIVYIADINDRPMRACETFRFDTTGRVVDGEALYGIAAG
ncbi:MAG: nuclear transport factor 2 family protein [Thermomicrobiales bacterium]